MKRPTHNPKRPTFGIEVEEFIVNCDDNMLAVPSDEFWEKIYAEVGGRITPEFKKSQIEFITGIHTDPSLARDEICGLRYAANKFLNKEGLQTCAIATHPSADWRLVPSRDGARYDSIRARLGDKIHQLVVNGIHVHIGTFLREDGELDNDARVKRIAQYGYLAPILIAISASSPFFDKRRTGDHSSRRAILNGIALQTNGNYRSGADWDRSLAALKPFGVETDADCWYDVRLGSLGKPTIEVRCCDTMPSIDAPAAIAAFLQAYEYGLRTHQFEPRIGYDADDLVRREYNAREAAKFGLSGFYRTAADETKTLRSVAEFMIETTRPFARDLGTLSWHQAFANLVRGKNPAEKMLELANFENTTSFSKEELDVVMNWAVTETQRPPVINWDHTIH